MTQTEFIRSIAYQTGITQDAAKNILALAGQMVEAAIRAGESIKFPELGTFTPVPTKERKGRNPRTGEEIAIPARTKVKFKASFSVG